MARKVRDAGFGWEGRVETEFGKGAWYIKLEPGKEWQNHAHAEKIFQQVVNHIRANNGLEPFVPEAAQGVSA